MNMYITSHQIRCLDFMYIKTRILEHMHTQRRRKEVHVTVREYAR